jgi:hypothetical protein
LLGLQVQLDQVEHGLFDVLRPRLVVQAKSDVRDESVNIGELDGQLQLFVELLVIDVCGLEDVNRLDSSGICWLKYIIHQHIKSNI